MSRRKSRKLAFQILFQVDQVHADPEEAFHLLCDQITVSEEEKAFAQKLIQGVLAHQETIDDILSKLSKSWKLEQMFTVDRVVLRLGSYEMLYGNVPVPIAINEAVEITKAYGDEHSPGFVNAMLDQLVKQYEKL